MYQETGERCHFVIARCYLPLFSDYTHGHVNHPSLFPQRVCSTQCLDIGELDDISRCGQVNVISITDLAFIFLVLDLNNHLYSIQGISNAFIIQFKYSTITNALEPLSRASFFSFPDLHPLLTITCIAYKVYQMPSLSSSSTQQ